MEARQRRAIWTIAAFALIGLIAVTVALVIARRPPAPTIPAAIHKIKHVVIVMQENRSFDNYFGTYPGAAGIPMKNGVPTVCNADPKSGQSFIFRIRGPTGKLETDGRPVPAGGVLDDLAFALPAPPTRHVQDDDRLDRGPLRRLGGGPAARAGPGALGPSEPPGSAARRRG